MTIGKILRRERLKRGLSQRAVWQNGGVDIVCQSRLENEASKTMSIHTLVRWCKAIGCDPVEVFREFAVAGEGNR